MTGTIRGRDRHPVDLTVEDDGADTCRCGSPTGTLHTLGCTVEECPWSDTHPEGEHQLAFCGCLP